MAKEEQIKSQIILEGEKEYRAACKGINTSLREIGSEMKLATAEFGDNAESIEALTRKQDILQKQLDEQAKKAKAAEAALKKMREGGIDPTDPAYQKMQTNLNNTRAEMVKVQRELDDTSKKLKSSKIDWESVGDTVGKVGKAIGAGVAAMGAAIGAAATAFLGLAESTREARENMGKLEAGFTTAGHSAEDAKNTYTELYGILGDDGQATEAAAHLAQLTNNEQELATWTDIATGVYATFGDSLPIENLTEAANETAKTGQITGGLADALNWAGVSEDEFQSKLDACTTEQERQALITETLNGLYSDAAEAYREVNGDIIEAQKATANLNSAMAALGAIAEPIVTKLKQLAADLLQQITPFVELIGTGLTGALEGAEGAAQQFSEGLLGLVTFIVEQLGTMLPTFLEFASQMIGTLATGIAQALPTLVPTIVSIITQLVQTLIDNTDPDNDVVNVVEKIDGSTINTRNNVTLGETLTLSVGGNTFTGLTNAQHTIEIVATDSAGNSATRTLTFTKAINSFVITLSEPLEAESQPTRCNITVNRDIPAGGTFKVEACNNPYDVQPVWEDCTNAVISGLAHVFENTVNTATQFGLNIRVTVERGDALTACWVSGIGGNFE